MRGILSIWVLIFALSTTAPGQKIDESRAAALKGAYMSSIAQYTTWPDACFSDADAPIAIVVLGEDPHGIRSLLQEAVEKKRIAAQGHPITVQSATTREELTDSVMDGCHILFLTRAENSHWEEVASALAARPVITIAEFKGFAESGGMIEFVPTQRSKSRAVGIDMHVNLKAVREADLHLSSKFLGLLKGVIIVRR